MPGVAKKVTSRLRSLYVSQAGKWTAIEYLAALLSGARADVYDPIRGTDDG